MNLIITLEPTNKLGNQLLKKWVYPVIKKNIKRENRINHKKNKNCFGFLTKEDNIIHLKIIGDDEHVLNEVAQIETFLKEKLQYLWKNNGEVRGKLMKFLKGSWEKIRKISKEQLFRAYSFIGIHIKYKIRGGYL